MTLARTLVLAAVLTAPAAFAAHEVEPLRETAPVFDQGDSDDPAIWVNPADPRGSLILGTYKEGGLGVFDLSGRMLQFLGDAELNNVDLVGNRAFATNRKDNTVVVYAIDPASRRIEIIASLPVDFELYGLCAGLDGNGKVRVVLPTKTGAVHFYEVREAGRNRINFVPDHVHQLATQSEGCVMAGSRVFVSEEDAGLWSLPVDPSDAAAPALLDQVDSRGGRLAADVEGVTVMHAEEGDFVLVSSQGNDKFLVFDLEAPHGYRGKFEVKASATVDKVTETDGIAAMAGDFGDGLGHGMIVVHDDADDSAGTNFKIVSWRDVARELGL